MQLAFVNGVRNQEYLIAFGNHLRKLRKSKGLTIEQLALKANIEYRQVADIERAIINTTISTIHAIAKALEIHEKELFDFDVSE